MGKAAKNEQLKLKATFYNNLAVGAVAGGVFIPLIALYQNTPISSLLAPFYTFPPGWGPARDYQFMVAAVVAFLLAFIFRDAANRAAAKIED
jgi:hypothetical protein